MQIVIIIITTVIIAIIAIMAIIIATFEKVTFYLKGDVLKGTIPNN